MGLFGRKKDAQGFYTGDAPVSAPGVGGAEPGAYTGLPADSYPWTAAPGSYPTSGSYPAPDPEPAPGAFGAPPATPPGAFGVPPGTFGPPPAAPPGAFGVPPGAPPGPTAPGPAAPGPHAQAGTRSTGPFGAPGLGNVINSVDPATAQRIWQQLESARTKTSALRRVILLIVFVAVLVPAGFAIAGAYHAYQQTRGLVADAEAMTSPDGLSGRHVGPTALGEPVVIATDDASYEITVFGAVAQPGDAWDYAQPGGAPMLVVDAQITRTDAGTAPVEFTGWNWSVIGSGQDRVAGDIITNYLPSLDGPQLVGGQSARGYVTFATNVTSTSLTVAASPYGVGLATWQIEAVAPRLVEGTIGKPALAEISRPGFTVTIGEPSVLKSDDERVGHRPESGSYLVLPVEFAGVAGASGHLGTLQPESFVFVPDHAPALFPASGAVYDAASFYSLDAAEVTSGALAFDTAATAGTLELRDGADRRIITWRIDAG